MTPSSLLCVIHVPLYIKHHPVNSEKHYIFFTLLFIFLHLESMWMISQSDVLSRINLELVSSDHLSLCHKWLLATTSGMQCKKCKVSRPEKTTTSVFIQPINPLMFLPIVLLILLCYCYLGPRCPCLLKNSKLVNSEGKAGETYIVK